MILHRFKPRADKSIPFIIFLTFLGGFVGSRLVTFLFPALFIPIHGEHIHHFSYGIILLAFTGFLAITYPITPRQRLRLSALYGLALGLAFDEFAMWIELEDSLYRNRLTYDAIIIIGLLLLNVIYFSSFWHKWGHRLGKLLAIILLYFPKKIVRLFRHLLQHWHSPQ